MKRFVVVSSEAIRCVSPFGDGYVILGLSYLDSDPYTERTIWFPPEFYNDDIYNHLVNWYRPASDEFLSRRRWGTADKLTEDQIRHELTQGLFHQLFLEHSLPFATYSLSFLWEAIRFSLDHMRPAMAPLVQGYDLTSLPPNGISLMDYFLDQSFYETMCPLSKYLVSCETRNAIMYDFLVREGQKINL